MRASRCVPPKTRLPVQRRVTGEASGRSEAPAAVQEALRSPGRPLPSSIRQSMEARFGHDFSRVRVHADGKAAAAARAVNARAYTVGRDVVFDSGQYAPETLAGQRLLAHELTHVVQQERSGGDGSRQVLRIGAPSSTAEQEARQSAAHILVGGTASPRASVAPGTVQRDNGDGGGTPATSAEQQATNAELFCDILELCRLHASAPTVMTDERLRAAIGRCRPGVPLIGNPCLQPNIIVPAMGAAGQIPGLTPTRPRAGGRQSTRPTSGGLNLGALTEFHFNLGPAAFNVSLPSSLRVRLPVPLRDARRIVFSLEARTAGAFSFSATLDGLPHIRIAATAGVDVTGRTASAGLTFATTRTVCRVTEPTTARAKIETAGRKLQTAITNLQHPPTPRPGAEAPSTLDQLTDIASAISDMYNAIESVKGPCREVPRATLQFGVRTPIDIGTETPGERERRPASFIGGTLTIPF